jgi:hypothetical protein
MSTPRCAAVSTTCSARSCDWRAVIDRSAHGPCVSFHRMAITASKLASISVARSERM